MNIVQLNQLPQGEFVRVIGPIFDQSPWVAEAAWARRPFADSTQLFEALCAVVRAAGEAEKVALIRAQPDFAGRAIRSGRISTDLPVDKAGAVLNQFAILEIDEFQKKNAEYRYKFAFPFVIHSRLLTKAEIFSEFERRSKQSREQEINSALEEIFKTAAFRIDELLSTGLTTAARLTVQVLDLVAGGAADGMTIELWSVQGDDAKPGKTYKTNADGRPPHPLLVSPDLKVGDYLLQLFAGDYFAARSGDTGPRFLDRIQIRFSITHVERNCHLVVSCAPGGYSVWRGA